MENEESDAGIKNRITKIAASILLATFIIYPLRPSALQVRNDMVRVDTKKSKAKVSWYGGRFNGRRTASGEVYCKDSMTCAHNTLPFNTKVDITLDGITISVRVNDRGRLYGRDFDLSEGAARALAMIDRGVAEVYTETK